MALDIYAWLAHYQAAKTEGDGRGRVTPCLFIRMNDPLLFG